MSLSLLFHCFRLHRFCFSRVQVNLSIRPFSKRDRRVAGFRSIFVRKFPFLLETFSSRRSLMKILSRVKLVFPQPYRARGILESGEFSSNFSNPFPRVSSIELTRDTRGLPIGIPAILLPVKSSIGSPRSSVYRVSAILREFSNSAFTVSSLHRFLPTNPA